MTALTIAAGATGAQAQTASQTVAAPMPVNPISPAFHAAASTPITPLEMNVPAAAAAPAVTFANASALLRGRPDRPGEFAAPQGATLASTTTGFTGVTNANTAVGQPVSGLEDLVAQNASAETPDAQFECLARTVYFESRGEPIEGQLAVAEVVLNRTRSSLYAGSICDVVTQRAQFSFVRNGVIPDVPRDSAAWRRSVGVARVAMNNLASVTGRDSLFFHATYVRPSWGRVRPRIAQIGNHIFFR